MNRILISPPCFRLHALRQTILPVSSSHGRPLVFSRASSMSAITRGIRRSFRDPKVAAKVTERRKIREAAPKPTFKIRKGKKDITDDPFPRPKSRKSRFYDPKDVFGKKSLVYQAKTGGLSSQLKDLSERRQEDEDVEKDLRAKLGPLRSPSFSPPPVERKRENGRAAGRWQDSRGRATEKRRDSRDKPSERRRDSSDRPAERRRDPGDRPAGRRRESSDRPTERRREPHDRGAESKSKPLPTIPYTTAASQFLYGRFVVEAALKHSRRKLYKLYIYGGKDERSKAVDDPNIENLARRKGVETVVVGAGWQHVMNRMSKGRPHNGYLLEASPLPQLPLKALGAFSESDERGPGYHIELAHQSKEEAEVNGAADFVPVSRTGHKPLVLLLEQLMDPGNLGGILRSANFLGASAVVISRGRSADLTSVALKASAGAAEAMSLFSVDTSTSFLAESKKAGWKVFAAVPAPSRSNRRKQVDLFEVEVKNPLSSDPCILVVGNEGEGLSKALIKEADYEVSIPNLSGSTAVDSLNVSVAAGLLCSSFLKGQAASEAASKVKKEEASDELGLWEAV